MLSLVLLAIIGTAIVAVRLYLNGREQPETGDLKAPASESLTTGARTAPNTVDARSRGVDRPSAPGAQRAGRCPRCGSKTQPAAKFCAECGRRLVTGAKR